MILYHGSNSTIESFSTEFTGKGNDQYGPGIYFSDSIAVAKSYGDKIYVADVIKARIRTARSRAVISRSWLKRVIKKYQENWMDLACNWDENPAVGLEVAIDSIVESGNYGEQIQSLWSEFFMGEEPLFCRVMSKSGIDGIRYTVDGCNFVTLFNPKAIKSFIVQDSKLRG